MKKTFQELVILPTKKIYNENSYKFLENKKILITGSTGLIGHYFIGFFYHSLNSKFPPKKIDLVHKTKLPNYLKSLEKKKIFNFIKQDITKIKFKNQKYDYIIHLSSYGQPLKFLSKPLETFELNTSVLKRLLEKTKKNGSFLYLSTSEVYSGINKQNYENKIGTTNTNHIRACYIQSKLAGETLVNIFKKNFKLNAKSVRLCLAYGPGNKKDDKRVLYQFIEKALKKSKINMLDAGLNIRSYIYALDAVEMLINILFKGKGDIYNIGGKEIISIKNLAKKISKLTKSKLFIPKEIKNSIGAPNRATVSIKKYEDEFGKKILLPLEKGLKLTIDWQKKLYKVK
jgi:UDP-glucuronate decarboxylase